MTYVFLRDVRVRMPKCIAAREPAPSGLEGMPEKSSGHIAAHTQEAAGKTPVRGAPSSERTFSGTKEARSSGSAKGVFEESLASPKSGVTCPRLFRAPPIPRSPRHCRTPSRQTSGFLDGERQLRFSGGAGTSREMFFGVGHAGYGQAETDEAASGVCHLLPSSKKLSILEEKLAMLEALDAEGDGAPVASNESERKVKGAAAETSLNGEERKGTAFDTAAIEPVASKKSEIQAMPQMELLADDDITRYCQRCHNGTARSRWVAWSCSACGSTKWLESRKLGQVVGVEAGEGKIQGIQGHGGGKIEGNQSGAEKDGEGEDTNDKMTLFTRQVASHDTGQTLPPAQSSNASAISTTQNKSKIASHATAAAPDSGLAKAPSSEAAQSQNVPVMTSIPLAGAGMHRGNDQISRSDKAAGAESGTGDCGRKGVELNGCAQRVIQGALELVGTRGQKKVKQNLPINGTKGDAKSQGDGNAGAGDPSNFVHNVASPPGPLGSSLHSALGTVCQSLPASVPPPLPPLDWTSLSKSEKRGDLASLQQTGNNRLDSAMGAESRELRSDTRDSSRTNSSEEMTTAPTSPTVSDRETDTLSQRERDQEPILHRLQVQVC